MLVGNLIFKVEKCILIPIQDLKKSIDIIDNIKRLEFLKYLIKLIYELTGEFA